MWLDLIRKYWFISPFIFLVIGTYITWALAEQSFWASVAIGFIWALLVFMVETVLLIGQATRKDITDRVDKFERILENRTDRIIKHFAIGTKEERFSKVLEKLGKEDLGNLRWALAKFISHRLYKSFEGEDREIVIDEVGVSEYSELLTELTTECRKSIYFTCPYTPYRWFRLLNFDKCKSCTDVQNCQRGKVMLYEIRQRASHLIELFGSNVAEKIRILNVADTDYGFFERKESIKCIENFVTYFENGTRKKLTKDHKILVKVIKQSSLNPHQENKLAPIVNDDFNVLDEKLVMMWDQNKTEPQIGKCTLILQPSMVKLYSSIFQTNKIPDDQDIEKILGKLKEGSNG